MAKKRRNARKSTARKKSSRAKSRRRASRVRKSSAGVSRKSLAVMLVLVIAVSVLGTWVMLNSGSTLESAQSSAQGKLSFSILGSGKTAPAKILDNNEGGKLAFSYKG